MIKSLVIFISLTLLSSCATSPKVKNVILFIGDGMGPSTITAARVQFKGKEGDLNLDKFPYHAKVKTYNKGYIVTDSASAATAMATGNKVEGGVVGQSPEASPPKYGGFLLGKNIEGKPVSNLVELAAAKNYTTAVVTNNHVFHATPAAFIAHSNDRNNFEAIAKSFAKSPVDLLFGGGQDKLAPYKESLSSKFKFFDSINDKNLCNKSQTVGLFAPDHLKYVIDREKDDPVSLKSLTHKALDCISKKEKNFFMMVEGGRIDHALHERKTAAALYELNELDEVVGETIKYLADNDMLHDTLILVTADHDTGGLSMNEPFPDSQSFFENESKLSKLIRHYSGKGVEYPVIKLSTDRLVGKNKTNATHTGVDVDLYAIGPTSEKVHGTIENTDIFKIIKEALGL
jgi:alkaline phosphatase